MADNKIRNKLRKNRGSIDETHMGPEPVFQTGETGVKVLNRYSLWAHAATWYNYYLKPKDYIQPVLTFATEAYGYDKNKIKTLKKLKDWELSLEIGKVAKIYTRGYEYTKPELKRWGVTLESLYQRALATAEDVEVKTVAAPVISIQDRQKAKLIDTICVDWDVVVDGWIEGDFKQEFDTYKLFKQYQLKGSTLNLFKEMIMAEYQPVKDAYSNTCDQAVEAYSHISKRNQKKMLALMETIFEDLDKLKVANKAVKIPKAKKTKASDVQIKSLKFKVEDIESKISSINPVMIPGSDVLFVYNVKTRKLIQLVTNSTKGFEVSGTTIKNICETASKQTTLRKPEDILPLILSKSIKQIDKQVWGTLTTKVSEPNGRINADCILLRAL
jgi:hypothetical protein